MSGAPLNPVSRVVGSDRSGMGWATGSADSAGAGEQEAQAEGVNGGAALKAAGQGRDAASRPGSQALAAREGLRVHPVTASWQQAAVRSACVWAEALCSM